MLKLYIQAFKESFKQWTNFNRKKFYIWTIILAVLACLKVYPEIYKYPGHNIYMSTRLSKIFSYSIPYNKDYLKYITKTKPYGQQVTYLLDNGSNNLNRFTHTYNSNLKTISKKETWCLNNGALVNLGLGMPNLLQYIKPARSIPAGFDDKKDAYSANYVLETKQQYSALNALFTSSQFVKQISMRKTLLGNIVLYVNNSQYTYIAVINPRKQYLSKCYFRDKTQNTLLKQNSGRYNIYKYTYSSNFIYKFINVTPLKKKFLNTSYYNYMKQRKKEAEYQRDIRENGPDD